MEGEKEKCHAQGAGRYCVKQKRFCGKSAPVYSAIVALTDVERFLSELLGGGVFRKLLKYVNKIKSDLFFDQVEAFLPSTC